MEIGTAGFPSRCEISRGLAEIKQILRPPYGADKHRVRRGLGDVDEFEEDEEQNFLENELEKRKLEDENLEVYLVDAQEVKDLGENDREAIDEAYNRDIGSSSDEDDGSDNGEEEKKCDREVYFSDPDILDHLKAR